MLLIFLVTNRKSSKRKRENSESTGQSLREGVPLRSRLRYRGPLPNFEYVNWMDDGFVAKGVGSANTWLDFVSNIGEENLKMFPIRKQQKHDCTVYAAVTAYEVQNRVKFKKDVSKLGDFKRTKKEGAHLVDQIPRVWGKSNPKQPKDMLKYRKVLKLSDLVAQVQKGPVYLGVAELGYPWANRASNDEYGRKEKFIPPRFDPYNNPWDYKRRSGADGHAVVVIGMFYSHDLFGDGVSNGHPQRKSKRFGNVFVTKCTSIPCGWDFRPPWSKVIKSVSYSREEISYALLPADLFTTTIRDGGEERRAINDGYAMTMSQAVLEKIKIVDLTVGDHDKYANSTIDLLANEEDNDKVSSSTIDLSNK